MRYDKINKNKIKILCELEKLKVENEGLVKHNELLSSSLNGMMHEVRRFSSELSDHAEGLSKLLSTQAGGTKELSETIFFTSGMLASRLAFTDIELNPAAIRLQIKIRIGIYKKFDKARYILSKRARAKQIKIIFKGNSIKEFEAIDAFELVPFVILDNAIKYSPSGREIIISFEENSRELEVIVSSCGPQVEPSELPTIFMKGVRGRNGASAVSAGDGLGLYLAKTLCDLTSISISATSSPISEFEMSGIAYSTFEMKLRKANFN